MTPERASLAKAEFEEALKLLGSQNLKKFDPFDKVILSSKGIDNSILTSFRTLSKKNNTISDTFKILHQKFTSAASKNNSYAKSKNMSIQDRYP